MEKRREFNRDSIEVCRHCKSEGVVTIEEFDNAGNHSGRRREKCPTCGGSGLIRKRITGVVTVEPYHKKP